jgi:myo-inositol-1(or 4)-monophosphatase
MTDTEVAIALVEAGADVVRRCFGATLGRVDKGASDFATSADIEAENAMLAILRRSRPDDAVLAEESGRTGPGAAGRTWLLDPLCGTLNYTARMRIAAVNAALTVGDQCLAAAVADPFNEEVFWTEGGAAYVRSAGTDRPLRPDSTSRLVDLNLDPPFPNASMFQATLLATDSDFRAAFRPRVVSSSIALVWVATGQRAAYVTDSDLRDSMHFAAGLAICDAAGCIVTDLRGNAYGRGPTGLIAAADLRTHDMLLGLVRKQLVV